MRKVRKKPVGLLPLQAKDRFNGSPVFATGAVPAHLLAFKATIVAAISWLICDQCLCKAAQDGKILFGDAMGIIDMQIDQLSEAADRRVGLQMIRHKFCYRFIAGFITYAAGNGQDDRN